MLLERCSDKALEQGMRSVRTGFKLRMRLGGNEERMRRQLAHFHDPSIRGDTGKPQSAFHEDGTVVVVYFIAVSVSFVNGIFSVELMCQRVFFQNTGVGAKPQGAADILDAVLVGHKGDDRMGCGGIQLDAQAESKVGNLMGSGVVDGVDHAFDAAGTETARDQYAVCIGKQFSHILLCHRFRIDPFDVDNAAVGDAAVL